MKHSYSVSENLYKFLDESKMCDVTLVAGDGKKIPAHRLILSTATDFFYTRFTTPLQDQTITEINITNIDGATLDNVIKCFYTGEIEINERNVEALLAAASFLLFPYLEEKCTEFLTQPGIVNKLNCLKIWASARSYQFEDLAKFAVSYVLRHFRELVRGDDFQQLNNSDLMELLENDALAVSSEEDVFNAIFDWVEFDSNKRRTEFPNLVGCVRLHLLSSTFILDRVLLICQQFDCFDAFATLNIRNNKQKSKRSATFDVDLLAIDTSNATGAIESFCRQSKQWTRLETVTIDCTAFGAEVIDKTLTIIGGMQNGKLLNLVFSIDIVTKEKRNLQPMLNARSFHSTITHDGLIYAIGGSNSSGTPRTAERYNVKTNTWEMLPSMSNKRRLPALAIFLGKIFVMGGGVHVGRYHNSVECYDPLTNSWTSVVSMNEKRCGAQAGVSGGYLYVVGGFNGSKYLSSIERYEHQMNTWTMTKYQLSIPRYRFGMTVLEDWIIVAGGCIESKNYQSCEKLNLKTGEREDFPSMLAEKRECILLCYKE